MALLSVHHSYKKCHLFLKRISENVLTRICLWKLDHARLYSQVSFFVFSNVASWLLPIIYNQSESTISLSYSSLITSHYLHLELLHQQYRTSRPLNAASISCHQSYHPSSNNQSSHHPALHMYKTKTTPLYLRPCHFPLLHSRRIPDIFILLVRHLLYHFLSPREHVRARCHSDVSGPAVSRRIGYISDREVTIEVVEDIYRVKYYQGR